MLSFLFGSILLLFALFQIASSRGPRFYVDEVLWSSAWGWLFLLNGLLGSVFNQCELTNALVFLYVLTFLAGQRSALFGGRANRVEQRTLQARPGKAPTIGFIVLICATVGVVAPYELLKQSGMSMAAFTSSATYADAITTINGDFRTGLIEQTLIGKVAFAVPQAAMLLVGIIPIAGRYKAGTRYALMTASAVPLLLFSAVSTIRSPAIMALLLLFAGSIAGHTMLGSERSVFACKNIWRAVLAIIALLALLFFFQSLRLGDHSLKNPEQTLDRLRIWFAGYLPGFHGWLWDQWDGELSFGASSFRFLAGMLSGQSSYIQVRQSDIYLGNHTFGNACTMLRQGVNDFGLVGCGAFLFLWGALSRLLLKKTREGSLTAAILFACNLAAIVWSPNAWYFMYGSRVLAPLFAIAYLFARRLPGVSRHEVPVPPGVEVCGRS